MRSLVVLLVLVVVVLVVIQMWRGDALVCANGAIFAKSCDPVTAVDLPSDAVVAFAKEDGCPVGWSEYQLAAGRFIVGVGRHSEHNRYGNPVATKKVGEKGGEDQVKLKIDHMPSHSHQVPSRGNPPEPEKIFALKAAARGHHIGRHSRPTDTTGGNQPHDNMPPYVALLYCKRD